MRAAVVAETAPELENALDRRHREAGHVGKGGQKALVVRNDRRDLRLLQHDLREPDPIRVARVLPGQVTPAVRLLPGNEARCERMRQEAYRPARRCRAFPAASESGYLATRSSSVRRAPAASPSSPWQLAMLSRASGTFWLSG